MPFGFKKFWMISQDEDESRLNLKVHGPIVTNRKSEMFQPKTEQTVANEFKQDLARYPKVQEIHVSINSPGGEVFAALPMFHALMDHPAKIVTYNDGLVGSAATFIFAAGDERIVRQGSTGFYHNVIGSLKGNKKQIQQGLQMMEKIEEEYLQIYEAASSLSREELVSLLDNETTLSSDEMVAKGLATKKLVREKKETMTALQEAMSFCQNCRFEFAANMYDTLADEVDLLNNTLDQKGEDSMDWTTFFNSLSPEQQTLILTKLAETSAPLQASLTAAQTQLSQLQAQLPTAKLETGVLSVEAITADLSPEAKAQVEAVLKVAQQQQEQFLALQEEKKYQTFLAELAEMKSLPLDEASQKALYAVATSSPENYTHVKALLKVADTAMATQFSPVGDDQGVPQANTAFGKIEAAVAQKMKDNSQLAYADAMHQVVTENPTLWDAYRQEVAQ